MMTPFFVSGMFRSGTTLLARLLNSHPEVVCGSDPVRPLFNSFRYDVADAARRETLQRFAPLEDYFLRGTGLLHTLLEADLDQEITMPIEELGNRLRDAAMPFSGSWARAFAAPPSARTYRDLLDHCLRSLGEMYGAGKEVGMIGFKEVWTNEMIPAVLRSFEGSKAIIMVRDPRAVAASNNSTDAKYPIFFLARQWRKLAFVAQEVAGIHPGRVLLLRYEDLVTDMERETRRICEFLGIAFEPVILDPESYRDGDGRPWSRNSNFRDAVAQSRPKAPEERWRRVLEAPDLLELELIAGDWMEHCGYPRDYEAGRLLAEPPESFRRIPREMLAEWIRPYSFDDDRDACMAELALEKARLHAMSTAAPLDTATNFRLQIARSEPSPSSP